MIVGIVVVAVIAVVYIKEYLKYETTDIFVK